MPARLLQARVRALQQVSTNHSSRHSEIRLTGRADQQHALGDLGAHCREALWPLQELHHLRHQANMNDQSREAQM